MERIYARATVLRERAGSYSTPVEEQLAFDSIWGEVQAAQPGETVKYPRSPLRYPGGKSRAVQATLDLIPKSETRLFSPFVGGGSTELACSSRMTVCAADVFEPLVDFWQALQSDREDLADMVEQFFPIGRDDFYKLQKNYLKLDDRLERAAAFYVLNRSSFSGTTSSGGMSPGHPRFTRSAIQRLRDFRAPNFAVEWGDFRDTLPKYEDSFLYLDPPYLNGQALYGHKGGTHKGFDHEALADILTHRDRWIMSYNDSPEVRELYAGFDILTINWVYGMSKDKSSKEIVIVSHDFNR